jgi:hypothetical protein
MMWGEQLSTYLDTSLGDRIREDVFHIVLLVLALCVHTKSRLCFQVSVDSNLGLRDR